MGVLMFKALLWFLLISTALYLFRQAGAGIIALTHWVGDKRDAAREEAAYEPIRAARLKVADDNLRAATARANAWIQQHDAVKAKQESNQ